MKRFREMTQLEFNQAKNNAKYPPPSPFAKFHNESKGYDYHTQSGKKLCTWEVFFIYKYNNVKAIIKDNLIIVTLAV